MRKKDPRRLSVHRQTIRVLEDRAVRAVAGGGTRFSENTTSSSTQETNILYTKPKCDSAVSDCVPHLPK